MVVQRRFDTQVTVDMGTTIVRDKQTWKLKNRQNVKNYKFLYDKCLIVNGVCTVPWGYVGVVPHVDTLCEMPDYVDEALVEMMSDMYGGW